MKLVKESVGDILKPKSQKEIKQSLQVYIDALNKIKKEDLVLKPEYIEFDGGSSFAGSGKISMRIKELYPRWGATWRGDGLMQKEIVEFLNSDEIKKKIVKKYQDAFKNSVQLRTIRKIASQNNQSIDPYSLLIDLKRQKLI